MIFFFVLNSGHENKLWHWGTALIVLVFCRQCVWKGVCNKLRKSLDLQTRYFHAMSRSYLPLSFAHQESIPLEKPWNIRELKHFSLKPVPHTCLWPWAMSFQHIHAMFLFPLYLSCSSNYLKRQKYSYWFQSMRCTTVSRLIKSIWVAQHLFAPHLSIRKTEHISWYDFFHECQFFSDYSWWKVGPLTFMFQVNVNNVSLSRDLLIYLPTVKVVKSQLCLFFHSTPPTPQTRSYSSLSLLN